MIRAFTLTEFLFLLQGAGATLVLSAMAFLGGGIGGLLVALLRTAPVRTLRVIVAGYIEFFQGTPLLMQLFVCYFGVVFLGLQVSPWTAVAIGLTLNASAFLGEIWRGGIEAVPPGQSEAARALGLGYVARMRHVVLPQAFRLSLAPTVGFLVQLIKGTSLAAIIGFTELSRSGQIISNATYRPLLVFGLVGVIYFVICWPLSVLSGRMERRFTVAR
jgi:polar amino acid transport system permease protein